MDKDLKHKLDKLNAILAEIVRDGRFALAYSGGLDSRFLAHAAVLAGLRPLLLHAEGPHIAAAENRYARDWAVKNELELRILKADPLAVPEVAANDRMRCYHCKKNLFSELLSEADDLALCDGTQASDSGAYRPGFAALKELGIHSPLANSWLTKSEIRLLAAQTGMEAPGQKARPCLLTRFAYLLPPDRASLAALDRAEELIETVLHNALQDQKGLELPDFRLRRLTGDVIELHLTPLPGGHNELPEALTASLKDTICSAIGEEPSAIRVMPQLSGFFDKE